MHHYQDVHTMNNESKVLVFDDMASSGISPAKLYDLFEKGSETSGALLAKNHNLYIPAPVLLPGETLLLQQPKVTCVNTLSNAATGALHLTNYRIIFSGTYMQYNKYSHEMQSEYLASLGYRYQRRKKILALRPSNLKDFVNKSKTLRPTFLKRGSQKQKKTIYHLGIRAKSTDNIHEYLSRRNDDDNQVDEQMNRKDCAKEEVVICVPIMCIYDIKKFPKQYLENEKLVMLNPGIEILTTTYLSIKLCLGDEDSYDADELIQRLLQHSKIKSRSSIFAYVYAKRIVLPKNCTILDSEDTSNIYNLQREIQRLDLTFSSEWKVSDQILHNVYPAKVIIPRVCLEPGKLKLWSEYHCNGCFPVVVWKNKEYGNILLRSSQTVSSRGYSDTRNIIDEEILRNICSASSSTEWKNLVIFSDRLQQSRTSHLYPNCEIITLDKLPDLSSTHQSALKLQSVISKCDDSHYLSSIEDSGWINELGVILDYSLCIAAVLKNEYCSVLLSIGSGIERVAQISSLVQLLVDPYYRTLDGFQVLIQKEWLSIKYPFVKKNLLGLSSEEELSPIFLQFLDCVWQVSQQYPTAFQFSDQLLELLTVHSYSGRFGTFIDQEVNCNSLIEIWSYINLLLMYQDSVTNFNYDKYNNNGILQPNVTPAYLTVWFWFTQYRKHDQLHISSWFYFTELEKLQVEYKDLLKKRQILLKQLCTYDEYSDNSFNSSLCYSPVLSQSESSTSLSSRDEQDTYLNSKLTSFPVNNPSLINKWASADDVFRLNNDNEEHVCPFVEKLEIGRSVFFQGRTGAEVVRSQSKQSNDSMAVKSGGRKFISLEQYFKSTGINIDGIDGVRISKMCCQGYLTKQGGHYKTWLPRWFVVDLRDKLVAYYKDEMSTEPKGVFKYSSIRAVNVESRKKKKKYIFQVETYERTYYIEAPNEHVMNIWIACFSAPLSLFGL